MIDPEKLNEIARCLRSHWESRHYHDVAGRIGAAQALCLLDPEATVALSLSAQDIEVLHGAMILAYFGCPPEEGGTEENPSTPPSFDPSHN